MNLKTKIMQFYAINLKKLCKIIINFGKGIAKEIFFGTIVYKKDICMSNKE